MSFINKNNFCKSARTFKSRYEASRSKVLVPEFYKVAIHKPHPEPQSHYLEEKQVVEHLVSKFIVL